MRKNNQSTGGRTYRLSFKGGKRSLVLTEYGRVVGRIPDNRRDIAIGWVKNGTISDAK